MIFVAQNDVENVPGISNRLSPWPLPVAASTPLKINNKITRASL